MTSQAKFMVFARKDVSVWNSVVFMYLASDREDLMGGITTLGKQLFYIRN